MSGPTAKFRIMLEMDIFPELAAEFEEVWSDVGVSVAADPGNLGQWLMHDAKQPHLYYVVSDWTSQEEFTRFEQSQRHLHHRQLLHPYRRAGSMKAMTIVSHLPANREQ